MSIKTKEFLRMFVAWFACAALTLFVILVVFSAVIPVVKVAFAGPPFPHVVIWPRLVLLAEIGATAGLISATMSSVMRVLALRQAATG